MQCSRSERTNLRIMVRPGHTDCQASLDEIFAMTCDMEEMGEVHEAERRYLEILKRDPKFIGAIVNLGRVYLKLRKYRLAEQRYQQALKVNAQLAVVHFNLAICLTDMGGRANDAIDHYLACLAIEPFRMEAHYYLAKLYANKGQYQDAVRHYRRFCASPPRDEEARYQQEWACKEIKRLARYDMFVIGDRLSGPSPGRGTHESLRTLFARSPFRVFLSFR